MSWILRAAPLGCLSVTRWREGSHWSSPLDPIDACEGSVVRIRQLLLDSRSSILLKDLAQLILMQTCGDHRWPFHSTATKSHAATQLRMVTPRSKAMTLQTEPGVVTSANALEPLPSVASRKRLSCAGRSFETWPSNATNNVSDSPESSTSPPQLTGEKTSFVPFTHEQRAGFRLASFR